MSEVYNTKRRAYLSQNYIKNRALIRYLVDKSSITERDSVVEIGSGRGDITEYLLAKAKYVYAIEKDKENCIYLNEKFFHQKNFKLMSGDALCANIPFVDYKLFSNPPFSITSKIVDKYLLSKPFPSDAYLVLQKEVADRLTGFRKQSPSSIVIANLYKTKLLHRFKKSDFSPVPSVNVQLIQFKRREANSSITENPREFRRFLSMFFVDKKSSIKSNLEKKFSIEEITQMSIHISFNQTSKLDTLTWYQWRDIYNIYFLHST
ncbi:ribosomal RNA small subunit methyltransferase A [Roseibium sp. M-1]